MHKVLYNGYIMTYNPEISKTTMFSHSIFKSLVSI